jgi:hypothetical protein
MLIAAALIEGIGFAALFAVIKIQKTVVTVGCNYCFINKLNIIIDT